MTGNFNLDKNKFRKNDTNTKERCLKFDLYGKPISLTFQGNDKFRTTFGATVTIIVTMLLLGFGTFRFQSFLRIEEGNTSQISIHDSYLEYRESARQEASPLHIFAFGLGNEPVSASIGQFKMNWASKQSGSSVNSGTDFEIDICSSNEFCADIF